MQKKIVASGRTGRPLRRGLVLAVTILSSLCLLSGGIAKAESIDDLLTQAADATDQQQYDQSEQLLQQALAIDTNRADVHYARARNLSGQRRTHLAVVEAQTAERLAPKERDYAVYVGLCLNTAGDSLLAAQQYERILKKFPNDAYIASQAGYCYRDAGDRARSVKMFRACLKMDGHGDTEWVDCARVLMADGKYAEALTLLEEAKRKLESADDGTVSGMIAWLKKK